MRSRTLRVMSPIVVVCAIACSDDREERTPKSDRVAQPVEAVAAPPVTLVQHRFRHTATLLADGTVLVAGGIVSNDVTPVPLQSAELYVSALVGFETLPTLVTPRYGHTATRLLDGTVLIAGGFDSEGQPRASAELYLPDSRSFESVGSMASPRGNHLATLLRDGRVLFVDQTRANVEVYEPSERSFASLGPRRDGTREVALTLGDGSLLLLSSNGQDIFDPSTNRFSPLEPAMDLPSTLGSVAAATRLHDGSLGVFGTTGFARMGGATLSCRDDEIICNGQCWNVDRDDRNCGACGRSCAADRYCAEGNCQCKDGFLCGDVCTDLARDPANCGECGRSCAANQVCSESACSDTCLEFTSRCGDGCFDLENDPAHCGACDRACGADEFCYAGACVCQDSSFVKCGSRCVDPRRDPQNCGECGTVCADTCFNAACAPCPSFLTDCGFCAATRTDPFNCGGCGVECPSHECTNGACLEACPPGEMRCNSAFPSECSEIFGDPAHCGACGSSCNPDESCWASVCVPEGTSGQQSHPELIVSRSANGVWAIDPRGFFFFEDDQTLFLGPYRSSFVEDAEFAGSLHTATALPDGSVLTVGGLGTERIHRQLPDWHPGVAEAFPVGGVVTTLLPDGRALLLAPEWEAPTDEYPHVALAAAFVEPLAAAVQPTGEVLVVGRSADGPVVELLDVESGSLVAQDVPLEGSGGALTLPGGRILVANATGLELVSPASDGFSREAVSANFACERPVLARLSNGKVLAVGNQVAYEIEVSSFELSEPIPLNQPRCLAGVMPLPGGALLVGGGEGTDGTLSLSVEFYDSRRGVAETRGLPGTAIRNATALHWFDHPILAARDPSVAEALRLNSELNTLEAFPHGAGALRILADGSILARLENPLFRWATDSRAHSPSFPPAQSVRMNALVDFDEVFPDQEFPGNAPEGTTGRTQSSPTNVPVPVWFPAEGGWPSMGTLTKVGSTVSYRVPRTAFPGLGLLFLATNGELTGFGPLVIEPSVEGTECLEGGECASGYCVDGFCCNRACDGACEACSSAGKAEGNDGICGVVAAGSMDDACEAEPVETCGHDGTCDSRGRCASYPNGTTCVPGRTCSAGSCVGGDTPPGEGGAGGGGTDPPDPRRICDGETNLTLSGEIIQECHPYRCPARGNACATPCASNRDCAGGYACTAEGKCEEPFGTNTATGCGCRFWSSDPRDSSSWILALGMVGWFGHRRLRARRARERPRLGPTRNDLWPTPP